MLLAKIEKARSEKPVASTRATAREKPEPAPWWAHDFRRTDVSVLASLGFDSIMVDKILSHQPEKLSGVAAIYQRYEFAHEREQALAAWAAYVTDATGSDKIIKLQKRRAASAVD